MMRLALAVLWVLMAFAMPARASDETFTGWPYLTADGLGSAMTLSTLPESPSAFLINPAAMPRAFFPVLAHNHSARHFPGSQKGAGSEMDQLDNDYESVIMPLLLGSYAYGFTLAEENGWDYSYHPAGEAPYPRERAHGGETVSAYSLGWYPLSIGASLRKFNRAYYAPPSASMPLLTSGQPKASFASSLISGEGDSYGVLAGPPWMRYANVRTRLDLRKLALPAGLEMQARQKAKIQGWRIMPCAWISIAGEKCKTTAWPFFIPGQDVQAQTEVRKSRSITVRPFAFLELSFGDVDGKHAWGCRLILPGVKLKYAEMKDWLGTVTGYSAKAMADLHFYGIDASLW
jgi:hypothetical protein